MKGQAFFGRSIESEGANLQLVNQLFERFRRSLFIPDINLQPKLVSDYLPS